ncbi:MAG TPA: fibronectin type III domain-containing protein [Gammaproteobacteria bacterium]|nr:fibronectin type III domain-containing protein [Gammaproteobacteria bacterium]
MPGHPAAHAANKYSLLLLLLAWAWSGMALAQSSHPSCSSGYPCTTPQIPAIPTVSPNPSPGNVTISVINSDPYSWIELNVGGSSRGCFCTNPTFSRLFTTPGTYGISARRCLTDGSSTWCSNYSSPGYVTILSTPANPTLGGISPNVCSGSVSISWAPGSGYPSGATIYYDVQESVNSGTWTQQLTDTTATSWSRSLSEGATYRYMVRSRYYWNSTWGPYTGWTDSGNGFTMGQCPPAQPGAPSLSQPNPETSTAVSISWASVGTVLNYSVERSPDNASWTSICTTSGTGCTDSASLTRGATYYYHVRGNKSTVSGPWSSASSIRIALVTPPAPATPVYDNVTPYSYTVRWSSVGDASTGSITYAIGETIGGGSETWTSVGGATSQSYSGRSAATVYQYRIRACNPNSQCAYSGASTISFPGTPGAITVSGISDYGRAYTLSWAAASGSVASYDLQRSTDGGSSWSGLSNLDGVLLSEAFSGAPAGTSYQYKVRACNSQACGVYTGAKPYWVPAAPSVTPSLNTTSLSLSLSWSSTPATHYRIERSVNGAGWEVVSSAYASTGYTTSVTSGYSYVYRVMGCNAEGVCSAPSQSTVGVPPGTPATISVSQPAADLRTDVTVSWPAVTGLADGYQLERRNVTAGGSFAQIAQLSGVSYTDTGLLSNTQYEYRVRAYKGSLSGSYSPTSAALRIKYLKPGVNLYLNGGATQEPDHTYSAGYNGIYTLNWAAASGTATSFTITELEPAGAWQAATLTALSCAGTQCNYDKPFNNSGSDRIYRYRGQACNADYCSDVSEIEVHVKTYPIPGPATHFTYEFTGTASDGVYKLLWNAPTNTPPNNTGSSAEAVTYYRLTRTSPTAAGPWDTPHSDTRTLPYTQSFTGGTGGQTYIYQIVACFQPTETGATAVCSGTSTLPVRVPYAPPNQVSGLTHTGLNAQTGSYTLQWTAASGQVSYYEIERQADTLWVSFNTAASNSYAVSGHPNGERRSYRVRACNADACGAYTAAYEVYMPYTQPGVPTGLLRQSLDAAARRLTLAWSPPLSGQVQSYDVEQSTNGGSSWQATASTASTTLTVNGLSSGTNYLFHVRACNVDACSAYTSALTSYMAYAAPGIPGALSHDASQNNPAQGAFTARWTAPAAIDSALAPITYYQLEYSANGGAIWQAAPTGGTTPGRITVSAPAAGAAASATLSGLATGAAYSLRVRACNADACGANTPAYQVYLARSAPAAPVWSATSPSAADYDARRFTVQWTASGVVHHYQLESYGGNNNGFENWIPIAETSATAYTFIDRAYGETYRYRVRACSEPQSTAASCSAWAISADIRLKYPAPNAPGGIAVSDQSGGTYTLNWNGVLGWAPAYNYQLQENRNSAGWTTIATVTDPVQQYTRSGRSAATYLYRVRACNPAPDSDCSAWSPEVTVTVLTTPAAPASISANVFDGQTCRFNVSWTPPTSGQGNYHYEFALQINGGSWTNTAWTTGTSYNMIVGQNNAGQPHLFRVRARSLINGQYSAWGSWRTSSSYSTNCNTAYNSTGDRLYISAPRYSPTGQYTVKLQSTRNWEPGLQYRNDVRINGVWSSLGAGVAPPGMTNIVYGSSNPSPTGRYQYRIATCDEDLYSNDNPFITCSAAVDNTWDTLATDTTVLRSPGSVGTVRAAGLTPDPVEGIYLVTSSQFTLDWQAPPVAPGPATQTYEIQYRTAGTSNWMAWAEQSAVDLAVTLPEFGVAYDFRVRACAQLDGYVNCGGWSTLNHSIRRAIGAPRFPADTYPADGELQIYSPSVPLQWLPPLNMGGDGMIQHYEVTLRSRQVNGDQEVWFGPELASTTAPLPGGNDNTVQQTSVKVEEGGLKEFQIRACGSESSSSCGDALTFRITVVVPAAPPEQPAALSGQPDPDSSTVTPFNGALSGEFTVQSSGAASYNLPLVVPPGTAGMQPKLSLNYSSQAGNGIAGMGWSIGGVSVIGRCTKTLATDGVIGGVDYTDNDAYCLDGQRLISIGSNQYRTAINGFLRITKMSGGVCGTWFEVKNQSGKTLQYGNTGDSCINASRNTRTNSAQAVIQGWALNRVTDISGNYMNYKYEEQTALGANSFVIDRIEYTGYNSTAPYTAVDFRYETGRPDPVSGYQAGVGTLQARRLTRITTGVNPADTSNDPAGYGAYTLHYQEDADRISRLTSIDYCATDASDGSLDTQCMEPLQFEWSPLLAGWERLDNYTPPLPFTEYPGKDLGARMVDMDNDGLLDLLYSRTGSRSAYRNTGAGWQVWTSYQPPVDFVDADGKDLGTQLADINGDARPELLTSVRNSNNTYNVYEFNGSSWVLNASMALPEPATAYSFMPRTGGRINRPDTDNGLRLADLNGDGLIDLIQGAPDGTTLRAWRNTGSGAGRWELWPQYAPPVRLAALRKYTTTWPVNPPYGWDDQAYDTTGWLADFNGDGLPDLLYKNVPQPRIYGNTEQITYSMRFNTGSGWGPESSAHLTSAQLDVETRGPDAGIRLVDLNGDGLPDLVRGNHAGDLIMYNTGTGWTQSPFEKVAELQSFAAPIMVKPIPRLFADLNYDGRTDVLLRGNSWLSSEDAGDGWKETAEFGAPASSDYPAATRVADINGDGRTDVVNSIANSTPVGFWTQRSGPRRITAVKDGLGNATGIQYKALTDRNLDGRAHAIYTRTANSLSYPAEQEVNTPMQVVDRVTLDDGIGGSLTTEYAYKGLTAKTGGRGLQGFESMTAYKPDGTVATTRFGQRFPYTGLPLEVTVTYGEGSNARVLERTTNEYCHAVTSASNTGSAANPETLSFSSASGNCGAYDDDARNNESVFVFPRRVTVVKNSLGNDLQSIAAAVTTVSENTYGAFGYLSYVLTTTTGDGHTYTGETTQLYDGSLTDGRWLGRLQETTSVSRIDGVDDGKNTLKTRFEYYSNGLLKKEITEPDAAAPLKLVKAYAYDSYGHTTQTTLCASDFSYCEAGAVNPNAASSGSEEFRTTTIEYDSQGRYPYSMRNAKGHTETYEHRHPLGLQTRLIDVNSLESTFRYDPLGRKESITDPFGTTTFDYRNAVGGYMPGARYIVQENSPDAALARAYHDSKGRERRKLTQSLHGEWVAADSVYDHFGRVTRVSQPYFVYSSGAGDTYWTETDYDALGRVRQLRMPLGDIDGDGADDGVAVTVTDYQGFDTVVTDSKGRRKLKKLNARNQAVRSVEDVDGKNIPVDYGYDSQGNLTSTIVDGNAATTVSMSYDRRGNKTGTTDPDMGHWDYQYNGFGELVWQRDAKQQVTETKYDSLGRMTQRRETPAGGTVQTSTWVYDTASGAGIGKLQSESGAAGDTRIYSYTARGQLETTEYRYNIGGYSQTFTVSQTYDALGRAQLLSYPQVGGARLTVENRYSPFGGLWYVLDAGDPVAGGDETVYWIADMVDARGAIIQETLRNRNTINNTANGATGWLQKVESWDKDLNMIQQTRYAFDKVGNVASRERFRPWIVNPDGSFYAGANEDVVESFAYDSLDRLTGATVTRDGIVESSKSNDYSRLGNFAYKDSIGNTYSYSGCGGRQHAVCAAGGSSFSYDANGNLTSSTGAKARAVEYNVANMPTLISENGSSAYFAYGADQARVFKRSLGSDGRVEVTWYVGLGAEGQPLYEQTAVIDGGQITSRRHLNFLYAGDYHGGQSFAVHVQEETEDNNASTPNAIRYAGTEYYHRDHLGSVIAITGDTGSVEETRLLSFDAWGKRRNADWSEGGDAPVDQYTREGMRGNLAYTGHEAIPEVGLIHMNGRVYDPELGVFLSADPHVQSSDDAQSYNRYSYVRNNPLRYTDPSGYFLNHLLRQIPSGLATIISIALNFVPYCWGWCSAVFNMQYAQANGATFGEALLSGALSFFGAGFGGMAGAAVGGDAGFLVAGAVAGAFSGGVNAALNGGNFFRGALKGALNGAAMALISAAVDAAVQSLQPQDSIQEVNGSGYSLKHGENDKTYRLEKLRHMAQKDENGDLMIAGTVSISGNGDTAQQRETLLKANGTYTAKPSCFLFLCSKVPEQKLTIRLTATDTGRGDIHLLTRNEMAQIDGGKFKKDFADVTYCDDACTYYKLGAMHIDDLGLGRIQSVHEIFHVLGFGHRSGGLMFPTATMMYSADVQMLRDSRYYTPQPAGVTGMFGN